MTEYVNSYISGQTRILLAVVSVGPTTERNEIVLNNIRYVSESAKETHGLVTVDCFLFVYTKYEIWPEWVKAMQNKTSAIECQIMPIVNGNFVLLLKTLNPFLLTKGKYDYVHLLVDDVVVYPPKGSFRLAEYVNIMRSYNISVASAAIQNTPHRTLWPEENLNNKPEHIGRIVDMIEIQSITYSIDAWTCQWELIDTEYTHGWGLDIWFYEYCISTNRVSGRLGIIDTQIIHHMEFPSSYSSYEEKQMLLAKQISQWENLRGISLKKRYPSVLGEIIDPKKIASHE